MEKGHETGSEIQRSSPIDDERDSKRRFCDLEVSIIDPAGNHSAAQVENISENGCFVSLLGKSDLSAGYIVALSLPDGELLRGSVAWSFADKAGISFLVPLDSAKIDDLVKQSLYRRLERFRPTRSTEKRLTSLPRWVD